MGVALGGGQLRQEAMSASSLIAMLPQEGDEKITWWKGMRFGYIWMVGNGSAHDLINWVLYIILYYYYIIINIIVIMIIITVLFI